MKAEILRADLLKLYLFKLGSGDSSVASWTECFKGVVEQKMKKKKLNCNIKKYNKIYAIFFYFSTSNLRLSNLPWLSYLAGGGIRTHADVIVRLKEECYNHYD